jgi:hypothetical protein
MATDLATDLATGRPSRLPLGACLLLPLLLGTGGAPRPAGGGIGTGTASSAARCTATVLQASSALPADPVPVGAKGTFDGSIWVEVDPGEGEWLALALTPDAEGRATFPAPYHASGLGGGRVKVRVRSEGTVCPAAPLTVERVRSPEGAFADLLTVAQSNLDAAAARYDLDREALQAAWDARANTVDPTVPPPLQTLVLAQALLDHPEVDFDLRDLLEKGHPGLDAAANQEMRRSFDDLATRSGMLELFRELGERLRTRPGRVLEGSRWDPANTMRPRGVQFKLDLRTAEQLSQAMQEAEEQCGYSKRASKLVGDVAAIAGYTKNAYVAAGAVAFTTVGQVSVSLADMDCALLPQKLTAVRLGARPPRFEDEDDPDRERPVKVLVTAESGRLDAGKLAADAAQGLAGAVDAMTGLSKARKAAKGFDQPVSVRGLDEVMDNHQVKHSLNTWAGKEVGDGSQGLVETGPYQWSWIDISKDEYSLLLVPPESAVIRVKCGDTWCLKAKKPGITSYRVEPKPSAFPSTAPMPTASEMVSVPRILVSLATNHPRVKRKGPKGRKVTFRVRNADNAALKWFAETPKGRLPLRNLSFHTQGGGAAALMGATSSPSGLTRGYVIFDVPKDEDLYPYRVVAEAETRQGLREELFALQGEAARRTGEVTFMWGDPPDDPLGCPCTWSGSGSYSSSHTTSLSGGGGGAQVSGGVGRGGRGTSLLFFSEGDGGSAAINIGSDGTPALSMGVPGDPVSLIVELSGSGSTDTHTWSVQENVDVVDGCVSGSVSAQWSWAGFGGAGQGNAEVSFSAPLDADGAVYCQPR